MACFFPRSVCCDRCFSGNRRNRIVPLGDGDGYEIHVRNDFDKRGSHLLHRHLHLSLPAQARAMLRSVPPTLEAGPLIAQQNA